jgi:two-component system sensor histidine kinase QseC
LRDLADRAEQIDARTLSARFPISDLPRELLPICQRLNDLLDRVSTSMARERRFSADVAHELRTPLAELRTIADVSLSQQGLGADMTAALQDVRSSAVQLDRVVSTLLALARCDAGQQTVTLTALSLSETIRDVLRPFESAALARGLTVASGSGDAMVQTDRALLVAIITNLFSNSVAYTPGGGRIAWSLAAAADGVTLRVENTNPGLLPADLAHVFEPFWRRDAARTGGEHVGVGLALVAAYAQLIGAEATVSLPDAATVAFDLRLPRSVPDQ